MTKYEKSFFFCLFIFSLASVQNSCTYFGIPQANENHEEIASTKRTVNSEEPAE